jgi:hypothetical protein
MKTIAWIVLLIFVVIDSFESLDRWFWREK